MSITFCIMQSCSTEEVLMQNEPTIKTVSREHAIQFLQQNQLRIGNNKVTKTSSLPNYGAILQEEISNSDQYLTVVPLIKTGKREQVKIVLLTVNDTLKSAVFTMYPDDEKQTKDFTGRIMITNLSGEFKNGFRVRDGIIVAQFVKKITEKQLTRTANKITSEEEPVELREVVIPPRKKAAIEINYIFNWYSAYDNSNPDSYLWGFVENSGSGGGFTEPVVEDEIINELIGKAKCLNDLLDKNGDSFVKNLLANFKGISEFNIKIVSQDVIISNVSGKPINGSTTEPVNSVIVIKISTSQANLNPNLVVARTILHEYIHADIYRKLKTNNASLPEIKDFKKIFELYADNLDKDHSAMADLYLNSMIAALKEFHKMQFPNDYNAYINYYGEEPNDAFYEGLAWVGLKDNNVDAWVKLSEAKKEEIKNMGSRIDKLGKISPCTN